MARTILEVDAVVVDANGTFNRMSGYPKRFDSNNYSGDLEGTMKRAKAEYHHTLGDMYGNQAGRQVQSARLTDVYGTTYLRESIGVLPGNEPEPEGEQ